MCVNSAGGEILSLTFTTDLTWLGNVMFGASNLQSVGCRFDSWLFYSKEDFAKTYM